MADKLPSRSQDFSEWYNQVVQRAELADYGPSRGSMIVRPYGYALWENIQANLDKGFKKNGVRNAYFPMFIPESFLRKEAEHVEGFAPHLAIVTVAGAHTTYTLEAMMGDTRVLQSCTSHNLGDNFARGFGIQYLDKNNELKYVWQTSFGLSTRFVGAIIMVHGDGKGLVFPPRVAPTQIVIVPIWKSAEERARVLGVATQMRDALVETLRVELDVREGVTPGFKFNEWELRGVPLRIEIGPKDIEKNQAVLARRDTGEKAFVPQAELVSRASTLLDTIQSNMYARAKKFMDDNTFRVDSWDEFKKRTAGEGGAGFLLSHWCGKTACEKAIQEEARATIRVIPFDRLEEEGRCIRCGEKSDGRVMFGKSY